MGKLGWTMVITALTAGLLPWAARAGEDLLVADFEGEGPMELSIEKAYLNLPVKTGASKAYMKLVIDGETVRASNIELSDEPDFWTFMDLRPFKGRKATLVFERLPRGSKAR